MSSEDLTNEINSLTSKNNDNIQKIIEMRNNPNPVYIVCLLVGYIIVIYFLYVFLVKEDISGEWKDSDDNNYKILHNKFSDNIIIVKTDKNSKDCKKIIGILHGNLLILRNNNLDNIGVYLNNRIKWLDSKLWYKIGN